MVIKASSHRQIDALVRDLTSDRAVTRDTAVARLTVIGPRAVARLGALAGDARTATDTRAAAIRALEAIGDPRAFDAVGPAIADSDAGVAVAAIGLARSLLGSPRGVEAVDRLTAVALDAKRTAEVRHAAAAALTDLPASTVAPVFKVLARDPDGKIAALGAALSAPATKPKAPSRDSLERWVDAEVLEDPDGLRRALLAENGAGLPLTTLHRLVQRLREREDAEKPGRRAGWTTTRAAAHAALAARGSRVALYDLRETLESANEPLPVEFLTALTDIGDVSCLEPIAAAYAKAIKKRGDDWWRRHLADAFRAIVKRDKLTSRHAVMKKIQKRWPAVLEARG
jgi:HEAT repeat protein